MMKNTIINYFYHCYANITKKSPVYVEMLNPGNSLILRHTWTRSARMKLHDGFNANCELCLK